MDSKGFKRWPLVILVVILAATIITVTNIRMVFNVTTAQTENIGSLQMETISGQLQSKLNQAEQLTLQVAYDVDLMRSQGASTEALESYFAERKAALTRDDSCINVYAASIDWYIIPDFVAPAGFNPVNRFWYRGAMENAGSTYITQPYLDLATGSICFTVSRLLNDGKTVVSLDYNLSDIQAYIQEMGEGGTALIVAESGEIAGYSDTTLLGQKIQDVLPQYSDILELEKNNQHQVVLTRKIDNRTQTVFCSKTENNWYLMLWVDNSQLYLDSYQQLLWICIVNVILILAMLALYMMTRRSQKRAELELQEKDTFLKQMSASLSGSIHRILDESAPGVVQRSENPVENLERIRDAAHRISDTLDNMRLASESGQNTEKEQSKAVNLPATNKKIRRMIIGLLIVAMCVSVYLVSTSNFRLARLHMEEDANHYENELSQWISEQKSILSMFVNVIAADPDILEDYEEAVRYLNDITVRYSDISVTYMTNPEAEHTVIMNNGWQPNEGWHVEERQWYIDTLASQDGFSISSPYFDEQTGLYCVTFSQIVYDRNYRFLGIFGIDFYMDKLVDILSESYTEIGYAFLVDADGNIINHPNAFYQMNESVATNIFQSEYKDLYADPGSVRNISDYDGSYRTGVAKLNQDSRFTVIIIKDWWNTYGNIVGYSALFIALIGACVAAVYTLISRLIRWQNEVNIQLQEAAEKATNAGKAKSQFLAQMSHEIRTPINAVLGMNELIMRESNDRNITEYAQDIQSAGRTLLSLINSILDFSKIEDGKMEIIPVEYDTSSMINDLVNMSAERSRKKNLELKLEIDENLPTTMFGDDVRVRQVITNLLTNAIKYTEKGSVLLKIDTMEKKESHIRLRVSVADTGIGIREEDKAKLCQSFQRLDQERNHNIEGTGLGLSIVHRLLLMMNSSLQIESEYGRGSEFFFELDQGIVSDTPIGNFAERRHLSLQSGEKPTVLYAPEARILVVDDNDMNLKVVRGLMRRNGIVPDMVNSGMQCLDMLESHSYDVVFLDHMMPGMDGIETIHQIREKKLLGENTAVIALTANAIVGAREMYLDAGFDDYLSKPIDAQKLEQKLEHYLPKAKVSTLQEGVKAEQNAPAAEAAPAPVPENAAENQESHGSLVDIPVGLSYCAGDMEMYREVAQAYLEEGPENIEKLDRFYEAEDWKNYAIVAHAVKSTSRTIGAASLGDLAYAHELAGKAEDREKIDEGYVDFLALYQQVMDELKTLLEEN